MTAAKIIAEILRSATDRYEITERRVGFLDSHVCITTEVPLGGHIKDRIREAILWNVPAAFRVRLTFARVKA